MTMITPSYLGETIEYSSLHACRSTLEDPTSSGVVVEDSVLLAATHAESVTPTLPGEGIPGTTHSG